MTYILIFIAFVFFAFIRDIIQMYCINRLIARHHRHLNNEINVGLKHIIEQNEKCICRNRKDNN